MTTTKEIFTWVLQLIAAAIFFTAGASKMLDGDGDIQLFTQLGMEPYGRYIIGFLEILCALFLILRPMAALGAFIGFGIMLGALIAHSTVLGLSFNGDGGLHILMLTIALTCCSIVVWNRKHLIPFINLK